MSNGKSGKAKGVGAVCHFIADSLFRPFFRLLALFAAVSLFVLVAEPVVSLFARKSDPLTQTAVVETLSKIGEFSTYKMEYSGSKVWGESRLFPFTDVEIPGTYNAVTIEYKGEVKAGFEVAAIRVEVDETLGQIRIWLPECSILSNPVELVAHHEQLSAFNHIPDEVMPNLLAEAKAEETQSAIDKGIFGLADRHARDLITEILSVFEGYQVVFADEEPPAISLGILH